MKNLTLVSVLLGLMAALSCLDPGAPPGNKAINPPAVVPGDGHLQVDDSVGVVIDTSGVTDVTPTPVEAPPSTPNADTRIVLHAVSYDPASTCETPQLQGLDCATQTATTTVDSAALVIVYVYLIDYEAVTGIQLRLSWDPSWTCYGWIGSCRSGAIEVVTPCTGNGNYAVAFNPLRGGDLAPIGRLLIRAGNPGTMLTIAEAEFPLGTHVITAGGNMPTPIPQDQRGAIGVEVPGIDTCQPSGP